MSVESTPAEDLRMDVGTLMRVLASKLLRIVIVTALLLGATYAILLFDEANPESLAEKIQFLRRDPAARDEIIRRSQAKLLAYHTTEKRVQQLLKWIDTGDEPSYG